MLTSGEVAGIVIGFLALALAVLMPLLTERLKAPKLEIEIVSEQISAGAQYRFLHGRVVNRPHQGLRWISRNPAIDARVVLAFRDGNHKKLFDPIEAK